MLVPEIRHTEGLALASPQFRLPSNTDVFMEWCTVPSRRASSHYKALTHDYLFFLSSHLVSDQMNQAAIFVCVSVAQHVNVK